VPDLRIRLAGRFTVEREGQVLDDRALGNRKARLLLKLLAARRGRLVPTDSIVDALWGDDPPEETAGNIASLVSRLRGAIGREAISGGRGGYRLELSQVSFDVDDASGFVDEAESRLAGGRPALALTAADAALGLVAGGSALDDEPDAEWAIQVGREIERLARRARVAAWQAAAAVGDHRRALAVAQDACAADALDEEAHRAVMAAYHALGEPGEALATYSRLRAVLVEQLGADPGPATESLYGTILRGEELPTEATRDAPVAKGRSGAATPAPAVRGSTASVPDEAPFVGRDAELDLLLREWSRSAAGASGTVLIVGEGGIGKTRLAGELARSARAAGALVLEARCYEAERSLFLQPVVELVRSAAAVVPAEALRRAAGDRGGPLARLVPELAPALQPSDQPASGEIERRRVFESVATFFAGLARRHPLLLHVDDLDNCGASTVELIHFVTRWDSTAPLLVVGTVRSDDAEPVLDQLGPQSTVVELGALDAEAVRALARQAGVPDVADPLMRRTGGHTLFVLEALRAVAEDDRGGGIGSDGDGLAGDRELRVPDSLRSAVTARVRRCGAEVEDLLRAAVVAGSWFELAHVCDLLSMDGEDAARRSERARRAGLLVEDGAGYRFANDLIREVLYDTTPAPTRVLRHRRLAGLLTAQPEAAATHAAAAGDWPLAIADWRRAADRAFAAFANREAEELLDRAMQACAVLGDPALTAATQLARGRARLAQGSYSAADDDLGAARQLARAVGDGDVEATALAELGWSAYHARDVARAHELAERAAAHPRAVARARILVGRVRNADGDIAGSLAVLEPLAGAGEDDPLALDAPSRALALSCLGTTLAHGDRYREAIAILDEAVAACRQTGVLRGLLNARMFAAIARANLGDLGGALERAEQLLADAERFDAAFYVPRALNTQAWVWRELGENARARDLAQQALETSDANGVLEGEPAANALLGLAESALLADDDAAMATHLAGVEELVRQRIGFRWRVELRCLELRARRDPASAAELVESARRVGSAKYEALGLAATGDHVGATAAAERTGSPWLLASVGEPQVARPAFDAVVAGLPSELRDTFLRGGRLALHHA
jgi:DNA-binding SARP family transcriptional activator